MKLDEKGKVELERILNMQKEALEYEKKAKELTSEASVLINNLFGKPANAKLSWHDVIEALL